MNRIPTVLPFLALGLMACRSSDPELARYTVEGAVEVSGEFQWHEDLTIWEAVMQSRPLEASCDLARVQLCRPSEDDSLVMMIDLQHVRETGDTTSNVRVHQGDVIHVPARPVRTADGD